MTDPLFQRLFADIALVFRQVHSDENNWKDRLVATTNSGFATAQHVLDMGKSARIGVVKRDDIDTVNASNDASKSTPQPFDDDDEPDFGVVPSESEIHEIVQAVVDKLNEKYPKQSFVWEQIEGKNFVKISRGDDEAYCLVASKPFVHTNKSRVNKKIDDHEVFRRETKDRSNYTIVTSYNVNGEKIQTEKREMIYPGDVLKITNTKSLTLKPIPVIRHGDNGYRGNIHSHPADVMKEFAETRLEHIKDPPKRKKTKKPSKKKTSKKRKANRDIEEEEDIEDIEDIENQETEAIEEDEEESSTPSSPKKRKTKDEDEEDED
jgi:hypothetical protein